MIDGIVSHDTHQERVTIQVEDAKQTAQQLTKHGCELKQEYQQHDTYLKQPRQEILKIVAQGNNLTLMRLHENEGKLDVVNEKTISAQEQEALKTHYGVKTHLTHNKKVYDYEDLTVTLVTNKKGVFITLQADVIGKEVYGELGIKNPTIVNTSFAFL